MMKYKIALLSSTFELLIVIALLCVCTIKNTHAEDALSRDPVDDPEINPLVFGAKGDGFTDDTVNLQKALTTCSKRGITCRIPDGKKFYVTAPIFLWGKAKLRSNAGKGSIIFNVDSSPYLLNIGISGRNKLEKPFTGIISGVRFEVTGGKGGRVIFLWRTEGAHIINNVFDVGKYAYSATSSGNDNNWVKNGFQNSIRKNISIIGNKILAKSDNKGSEGIGLGNFDGIQIRWNSIIGVGDDPIGIHFSKNVKITNNELMSVDGRLLVVNSSNVEIAHNEIKRMPSLQNDKFYKGISLIYIGFETLKRNKLSAPINNHVHDNQLYYPEGAIDHGAGIYIYGPRNASVENNIIVNDAVSVKATALHLLPAKFTGQWSDPDNIDPGHVARVWNVKITGNISKGKRPLRMIMTGKCIDYMGTVHVMNNSASGYQFYCDHIKQKDNIVSTQ